MTNKRAKQVELAVEDLNRVTAPTFDGRETLPALVHAVRRLMDARPGHPKAQSYDGPGGGFTPASKPPSGFGEADIARQQLAQLDHSLNQLVLHARRVHDITASWSPRAATPKDRSLAAVNTAVPPGCQYCETVNQWAPARPDFETTTCKGNLPEPMRLCDFCYRFCLDTGALPTAKQLTDHHNGVRVHRAVPPQGKSA